MRISSWWLTWTLRVVGGITMTAFVAAVMPASWIVGTTQFLGLGTFPETPVAFYLARNLSLMYGAVGCLMVLVASDLAAYRRLVPWIARGLILLGIGQAIVDFQSGMPGWWIVGESASTLVGGLLIYAMDRAAGPTAEGQTASG